MVDEGTEKGSGEAQNTALTATLPKDLLRQLSKSGISSPDVNYAPAQAAAGELAEAALKYDPAPEPAQAAIPSNDNTPMGGDAVEADRVIGQLEQLIAAGQTDLADELGKLKKLREENKPIPLALLNEIQGKISAALQEKANDETPQQKVDRLWGELKQLNEEAKKEFDKLPTSEEEKKERKRLEEDVLKAKESGNIKAQIEAQRKLIEFYDKTGAKYDPDGPLVKNALEMQKALDELIRQQELVLKKLESELPESQKGALLKELREKFNKERDLIVQGATSVQEIRQETDRIIANKDSINIKNNAATEEKVSTVASATSSENITVPSDLKLTVAHAEVGQPVTPGQTPENSQGSVRPTKARDSAL